MELIKHYFSRINILLAIVLNTINKIQFSEKKNKQASFIFNLILLVWLAHLLANTIFQLLVDNQTTTIETHQSIVKKQSQKLTLPLNLFGIVKQKPKTYSRTKNTRLNLNLIGILNQGKKSLAIIKYNSKDNIYQIGDTIASGVTLKDVKKKYIILSRHGNLEKLQLKQAKLNKFIETQSKNTNRNAKTKVAKLSNTQKKVVKKYQRQLLTNPISLFQLVGIKPKYENDRLSGFLLFPTNERKLFFDLGFKKNDILIEINQNPLTNMGQAMRLSRGLAKQTNFTLTVKRNQQIKILSIKL